MFAKNHTDEFITHLQKQVTQLQEQVEWLEGLMVEKDEAFARERADLLNRLAGLPPQREVAGQEQEGSEPIRFESRTARMLREQQERQYEAFLRDQAARDKGLEEFRAEVQAEAAEVG
jgi:hypothetical protein